NRGVKPDDVIQDDKVGNVLARYKLREEDDLFGMIGFGGVTANQVTNRLLEKIKEKEAEIQSNQIEEIDRTHHYKDITTESGVYVEGMDNMLINLSKCCNPIPDRKSTRLNSSHVSISYAVFC